MKSCIGFCVISAIILGAARAQESTEKKTSLVSVSLQLWNGSLIHNVIILEENLKVVTNYGEQTIPFKDVRRINFGFHYPLGESEKISEAIKSLGKSSYKEREAATAYLRESKHFAYPLLKKALEIGGDEETTKRAIKLVEWIKDKCKPDLLALKERDVIHTPEFPMVGRISGTGLKVRTEDFGDATLQFSKIKVLFGTGGSGEQEIVMHAATHGSDATQWLDAKTTVVADSPLRITITAEGQIDLWPQGPGQYVTNPKGYTTAGKGSTFMAGALVGRVGPKGTVFLIGDRYDGAPAEEGPLFLHIVPSPWNNASTGSYRVRITTAAR